MIQIGKNSQKPLLFKSCIENDTSSSPDEDREARQALIDWRRRLYRFDLKIPVPTEGKNRNFSNKISIKTISFVRGGVSSLFLFFVCVVSSPARTSEKTVKNHFFFPGWGLGLLLFFFCIVSPPARAVVGSITDPALISEEKEKRHLSGNLKAVIARNTRVNWEHLWNGDHEGNLLDSMTIRSDLILKYPLRLSFLDSFPLDEPSFFALLSYTRSVYANADETAAGCWGSLLCIEDLSMGVSDSLRKTKKFSSGFDMYLTFPTSRPSLKKTLLLGLGASLNTTTRMFSGLSLVSSHILKKSFYSKPLLSKGNFYNERLLFFNQLGVGYKPGAASGPLDESEARKSNAFTDRLIPALYLYGAHRMSLNYNNSLFHRMSLNMSSSWTVNRKSRITAGLSWGDNVFTPPGTASSIVSNRSYADRIFVSLGAVLSF